jgi:pyruvate,water dikinase
MWRVVELADSQAGCARTFGAKAARLSELARAGFRVPRGLCIPAGSEGDPGELLRRVAGLRPPLAVRSSALVEDHASASFAGMFETILDVDHAGLLDAVRRCRDSGSEERVKSYSAARGIAPAEVAVLVQEMVRPDSAGVLFTSNPATHDYGQMVVDAAEGLGRAVVDGSIRPQSSFLDKRTGRAHGARLEEALRKELHRAGLAIEKFLGEPADIEWAWSGGALWILQARPITTMSRLPERRRCYSSVYVWTCANFAETMPRPASPMGWSLMEEGARRAFLGNLRLSSFAGYRLFERLYGRVYWNITPLFGSAPLYRFLRISMESLAPSLVEEVDRLYRGGRVRPSRILSTAEKTSIVAQVAIRLPWLCLAVLGALFFPKRTERGLQEFEARIRSWSPPPGGWRNRTSALWNYLRASYDGLRRNYLPSFLASVSLATLFVSIARRSRGPLEAWELLGGDRPDLTTLADQALWEHARGGSGLERFGHRGPGEQDVAIPRLAEDQALLSRLLENAARVASPADRWKQGRLRRERRMEEFLSRAPLLRPLARLATRLYPFRENGKHYLMLIFHRARRALLEIGRGLQSDGLVDRPDDIFFLTIGELERLARERTDVRAVIEARRAEARRFDRVRAPLVVASRGPAIDGRPPGTREGGLRGDPVSSGTASGRVRVILDPAADTALQPGEILVAPHTDPGWTPLFLSAAAVVTEVGGMLSHAAVVARELGVPAVVNVAGATRLLKTGDVVTVDGTTGEIRISTR